MMRFANWQDVPRAEWRWPNFSPAELACKGSGALVVVPEFLDRLQAVRALFGAMRISSGYRSPAYNARISSSGEDGPHTTGRAVDVLVHGAGALQLVRLALEHGFTGIGVSQKGALGSRFIHLDDLTARDAPRPTLWSY